MADHRGVCAVKIWTIGYEGRDVDELIQILVGAGIEVLMDVRLRPMSRHRPEFAKKNMAASCEEAGIGYAHEKLLGTPADLMKRVKEARAASEDGRGFDRALKSAYRKYIRGEAREQLDGAAALSGEKRVCLMCYERDASDCHRSVLAAEIAKATGAEVVNL